MKVLISSQPYELELMGPSHTVEAEYGEKFVEGTVLSLAHHGPRDGNPAPCLAENMTGNSGAVIGISHVDLDTVGGIMAILGIKPKDDAFWQAAAQVDVMGPHKLSSITRSPSVLAKLNAYWAFSEQHRVFAPRDGSVADVTGDVAAHCEVVRKIVAEDPHWIGCGEAWARAKRDLETKSFVSETDGVILRESDVFVNHLYGDGGRAVVAYNTFHQSVTVSVADPIPGFSCCDFVQGLWGDGAGGHAGIAGSPRGQEMSRNDADEAYEALQKVLGGC